MDFIARSRGDEFLVVLPTASEGITFEIIERIERAFEIGDGRRFGGVLSRHGRSVAAGVGQGQMQSADAGVASG